MKKYENHQCWQYHNEYLFVSVLQWIYYGRFVFTPGHTADSISLKVENVVFCGDAAMNGFPSIKRLIIWIENIIDFEKSWEALIAENADTFYPAHGRPFPTDDLTKYKKYISKLHLHKLK